MARRAAVWASLERYTGKISGNCDWMESCQVMAKLRDACNLKEASRCGKLAATPCLLCAICRGHATRAKI
jgi:hypothetical protein